MFLFLISDKLFLNCILYFKVNEHLLVLVKYGLVVILTKTNNCNYVTIFITSLSHCSAIKRTHVNKVMCLA